MNQITFVPVGGLANRMRSIASVITLAQQTKSYVNIIWFQDWALHAPFHKLFEPINQPHITLKMHLFSSIYQQIDLGSKISTYLVFTKSLLLMMQFMNVHSTN